MLELDTLLSELSLCSTRTQLYFRFLHRRASAVGASVCVCVCMHEYVCVCMVQGGHLAPYFIFRLGSHGGAVLKKVRPLFLTVPCVIASGCAGPQSVEEVLQTCQTSHLEQELISKYILIEDYFMRESLSKAGVMNNS